MTPKEIEALDEAIAVTPLEHTLVVDYFVALLRNYIAIRKRQRNQKSED